MRRTARPAAWLVVGLLVVVAGCSTAPPPPSGSSPSAPAVVRTESAAAPATADATPLPGDTTPTDVPLALVTLVCESWGSEPPADAIPCRGAAALALAALGPGEAGGVRRLDVGFGDGCATQPACRDRRADVGWVLVRSATDDVRLVRVARDAAGGLRVWPPVASETPTPPAFVPPARVAPDLGPDAPSALGAREPYPYCGDEDLGSAESFDVTARRCFVDGVLAGSPVELLSLSVSTEGDPVLTLYRFSGRGSVARSVRASGAWTTAVCAISRVATPAAFTIAGGCDDGTP